MSNNSPPPDTIPSIEPLPGSMLEYQHRLSRLSSINQGLSNIQEAFVAVRLGQQNWLVELSEVQEALAPPRMARIASSPTWVAGVVGVRGQVWSVIDMIALSPDPGPPAAIQSRGWMTLLRDPPDSQGDRLALLWSDMVEVATKRDYKKINSQADLDTRPPLVSQSNETDQAGDSGETAELTSDEKTENTSPVLFDERGNLPPWTRAIWQDAKGQIWRELDTSQIVGPQGLVASWRQRVDVPSQE